MLLRTSAIERAFELADSGKFRIPSAVRTAMIAEGYTQSDVFTLEGRATWAQLRNRCLVANAERAALGRSGAARSDAERKPAA